tara:strand:- start:615 stop:1187 length:573 start_codon:yes stop_codon:yes gene_type:complete
MIIDEDKQVSDKDEGQDSLADENSETLIDEPENQSDSVSEPEVDDYKVKYEEAYDSLLRAQAEVENIKKRSKKEVENAYKYSIEAILQDIIPIFDSLSLSCSVELNKTDTEKVLEGNKMLLEMFNKIFEAHNINKINPLNEKFDPKYHQAISTIKDEKKENDIISEVVQTGYILNDRVIKPALVIVVKND